MASKQAEKRNRTIYYLRASYMCVDEFVIKHSLEHMVNQAWQRLPLSANRTFYAGNNKNSVGMKHSIRRVPLMGGDFDCTLLSVGLYEAGAAANTIPKPSEQDVEINVDIHDAPLHQEYLDGEGFICLFGDHVILSPTDSFRHPKISDFIKNLIGKAGFRDEASRLDIQQIADINIVNTIHRDGVKSILINASAYLSSFDYIKRVNPEYKVNGVVSKIINMASSMLDSLKDDDDPQAILDNENLSARITLTHNGKVKSENARVGADRLKDAAAALAETDLSGYTIVTKTDKKITHDEIVLRNKVLVKAHGKSVQRDDMWNKLVDVLVRYDRERILEH
ncbi:TPA: hypothetical protein P2R00_003894 [Aeromonas veronii]|nr:hypothetical protein [Aeromonas veronii]